MMLLDADTEMLYCVFGMENGATKEGVVMEMIREQGRWK
jgi:hypothetical protein